MKLKNILLINCLCVSSIVGFTACDYLEADEYLYEVNSLNDIWSTRLDIRKAWAACYGYIPDYSNMIDGFPFNCNYDEGHAGRDVYKNLLFAQGKFSADNTLYNFWQHYYRGIRICNQFLENSGKADDPILIEGEIEGYQADARFMRAYYYWNLLEMYGPFAIVEKTIDYSDSSEYPTKRNNYDECVDFLVEELDKCIELLPADEDILAIDRGRPSREAAMAMKSRVLLVAASPLVNGNPDYSSWINSDNIPFVNTGAPDIEKWKKAAKAAKDIIDLNKFSLFTVPANDKYNTVELGDFPGNDVEWPDGPAGIDPYRSYKGLFNGGKNYWNNEVIFQVGNVNTRELNMLGVPRYYNDQEAAGEVGKLSAVQKMVDQYYMNNGMTIQEAGNFYNDFGIATSGDGKYILGTMEDKDKSPIFTEYVQTEKTQVPNRILNREARLYATVGFIGRGYHQRNGTYYFADYKYGQVDGYIQTDRPSVRTGYQITKWLAEDEQSVNGTSAKQYPIFRMAEIYLNYAEALNEYEPTNPDIVKYLNLVRYRAGLPGFTLSDQATNRERIKRERYIEFAFEGKRYFDSRRWKDAEKSTRDVWGNYEGMGGQVYGCDYNATGIDFYNRTAIDGYIFKKRNYFLPIPYGEVANYWGTLIQNPGW